jgi:hypothetical protein
MAALDAEGGFEGCGAVVETCMDYLERYQCMIEENLQIQSQTSEFRELVSIPTPLFLSMSTVLVPSLAANCLAMARPTAPPPMTCELSHQLSKLILSGDDEPYSMGEVSLSYGRG